MKRGLAGAIVVLMAIGALFTLQASSASAAPSQDPTACFPGSDPDYPPTGNNGTTEPLGLASGQFNRGATGNLVITMGVPGDTYCGFIFSTPITLVPKVANAQGRLEWSFAVPSDFQLNAMHHVDIYKRQQRVGSFDFCVGSSGAIVATSTCQPGQSNTTTTQQVQGSSKTTTAAGKLPRTGSDVLGILQVAVLALGAGAGMIYLRRRRAARLGV